MVRPEQQPDYYADLELPYGADPNEVKKQYKRLALKYHPDRNPGHEQEFAAKFQAIQSANEILTDPAQRAKYDAQRIRQNFNTAYSVPPPTTSSFASTRPNVPPRTKTAGTNFPPPPRPPPYTAKTPSFSPPRASNHAKYAGHNQHERAYGQNVPSEEAKAKASTFRAWEQMRHGQGPVPPPRRAPTAKSPRAATFDVDPTSTSGNRPSAGAAKTRQGRWEDLRDAGMPSPSRASTFRHQPANPTVIPPTPDGNAANSTPAYFNVFRGDQPSKPSAPAPPPRHRSPSGSRRTPTDMPPPPPRAPTAKQQPDLYATHSHSQDPSANGNNRHSTPYMAHPHEKTFVASPGLHRANTNFSGRDHSTFNGRQDREGPAMASGQGAHVRAASAGATNRGDHAPHMQTTPSTTTDSSSSSSDDLYRRPRAIPKSRKTRMPAGTGVRSRTGFSPHVRIGDAVDEAEAPHSALNTGSRRHSGIDFTTRPPSSGSPTASHAYGPNNDANHHRVASGGPSMQRHKSFDEKYQASSNRRTSDNMADDGKDGTPIFKMPTSSPAPAFRHPPPLRSQSSDTINLKFSPSGAPPRFGGENPYFPPRPSATGSDSMGTSTPASPQSSQQSPLHKTQSADLPPPPKGSGKYSSEDWASMFGTHTFEPVPSSPASRAASRKRAGTPRMGSAHNLRRAGTFSRSAPFQPSVHDPDSDSSTKTAPDAASGSVGTDGERSSTPRSRASDGNAMDIDTTPPAAKSTLADSEGDGPTATSTSAATTGPKPPRSPALPPRNKWSNAPPLDSDAANLNLGGFRHVPPFAMNNEGLGNVDDLKSALPFPSQASSNKPATTAPTFEKCNRKLDLPKMPKTPSPPANLTQDSWDRYLAEMNAYIFRWNSFSAQILLLFQKRQEEHREIGPAWVGQVGGDCDAYLAALDEDERARKYWDVASDLHRDCFRNLNKVRGDLMRSRMGG